MAWVYSSSNKYNDPKDGWVAACRYTKGSEDYKIAFFFGAGNPSQATIDNQANSYLTVLNDDTNTIEEIEGVRRVDEGSEDSLTIVQNTVNTTDKKMAKAMIRYCMAHKNPKVLLAFWSLYDYLKTNFTANQIANFLNVSVAVVGRIKARFDAAKVLEIDMINDDNKMEEI